MNNRKNSSFLMHGAILAVSSIVVRIIGLIYRIPLNNILGEKGIAYYGVAFDVYSILLLLSSYSLPLAVSKMVARRMALKQYRNTGRIFFFSLCFALCCGVVAFCITFFGANWFAQLLKYPQAAVALRVLSPALIILAVMGVMRGYFQGLNTMIPTALSNIFEQIVNAVVSIVAAKALFDSAANYSIEEYGMTNLQEAYGAAGGTLGTVCGAAVALVFLIGLFISQKGSRKKLYRRDISRYREPLGRVLKIMVWTIVPVIISTTIYNISSLLDTGIFGNIMDARGMDPDFKSVLTGMYTGNYRIIVNVPIALASALASSLIPSLVQSRAEGQRKAVKRKVRMAVKVSMIVAMPCTVGIGVLAKPIVNLLFPTSVDPDKVAMMLMLGVISVVLYTLSTITNSILQGIDKMSVPVKHSAIALVIHIAVLAGLLYITDMNIYAVVICDVLFALLVCIFNASSLYKHLRFKQEKTESFFKPAVCSVVMGIFTYLIYALVHAVTGSNAVSVALSIILSIVIYGLELVVTGTIRDNELMAVPHGGKVVKILRKVGL